MPSRLTLALGLLLALAVTGLGFSLTWLAHYREQSQERFDQITALTQRLANVQAEVLQVEFNKNQAQRKLQGALDASPEWSGTAVPSAVADSLCQYLDCATSEVPKAASAGADQ